MKRLAQKRIPVYLALILAISVCHIVFLQRVYAVDVQVPVTIALTETPTFQLALYNLDGSPWEGALDIGPTVAGKRAISNVPVFASGLSTYGNPWDLLIKAEPLHNNAYEIPVGDYLVFTSSEYWQVPGTINYLGKERAATLASQRVLYKSSINGDMGYNRDSAVPGSPVPVYFVVDVPKDTPPGVYESYVEFSMTETIK